MEIYDEAVVNCFLTHQDQLFPEPVANTMQEAEAFLEDVMAAILDSEAEVAEYFEEEGMEVGESGVLDAAEVFDVGDGRFLIVES
ncbi:MAG: glyoxalase [Butyrivibrio sp.]|nr:glyoxalase [Butyrivibrio sp.]